MVAAVAGRLALVSYTRAGAAPTSVTAVSKYGRPSGDAPFR